MLPRQHYGALTPSRPPALPPSRLPALSKNITPHLPFSSLAQTEAERLLDTPLIGIGGTTPLEHP